MEPAVLVHGGVGQPASHSDGTHEAAKAALEIVQGGGDALDAVVKAVVFLEDDERFNAGTGSRLRLDGTVEMDALVMDSRGSIGAVAAISSVRNPVLVARKVAESPHRIIAGPGAVRFARRYGFKDYDPITEKNKERLVRYKNKISSGEIPEWLGDFRPYLDMGHDTVGAIAVDRRGVFAVAGSTGGLNLQVPGRVSDLPLVGCGLWAGKQGAVLSTGIGEMLIDKLLSYNVYEKMKGMTPKAAADWGIAQFQKEIPIGVLTISKDGWGVSANKFMACTIMTWAQTLNGNEIWPPEDDEQVVGAFIPPEASPELPPEPSPPPVTAPAPTPAPALQQEMGREEAMKAVHELTKGEGPAPGPQEPPPQVQPEPQGPPPPEPEPQVQAPPPMEPATPPEPKAQKFRCPFCQQIFSVVVSVRPVTVHCPHCGQSVLIE